MPGSEGGDRVHNFFDQEKCSHQHSQVVDGSRLISSGFHWSGNQRQGNSPLNFSSEQSASDPDRGNLDRQSSLVHSSSFSQSPQRPDFSVNPHLMQHTIQNDYIRDHHLLQVKHNETNFMGMNREPNQHNPFSRGLLNSGAQYGNGSEQYRDTRLEPTESPVNFDFLGSYQQMTTQQLGMVQSSPRQHSGLNERQVLQQQAVLRNLYEVQRQQQLQQQDIRQTNSVNNLSIGQQRPNDRSASLNNTTPFQDGSNYAWMPQHGAGNSNWLQGVASPVMLGTSNGIPFSPEQSSSLHIMGFSPQSVDHSLYGFPISNTKGSSSHCSHSMEKPMPPSRQEPSESIPHPANQYGTLLGQVSAQDREFGSSSSFHKNNILTNACRQGSYPGTTLGKLSHAESQQRNLSMEFQGIQGVLSSSMNSTDKTLTQAAFLQDAAPLDPTEEQFLFGSDDNIWDTFGKSSNSRLDNYKMVEGSEFQNPLPSMQSGSWSALMQSALAETCSGDTGNQEEWSGLNLCGKPVSTGHEPLAFSNTEKQRTFVTNGNLHIAPSLDTEHYLSSDRSKSTNSLNVHGLPLSSLNSSYVNERFQSNSASKSNQQISEGNSWFDQSNLKPHSEDNQIRSQSGHHPVAALNLKGLSSACPPQHGTSLNNICKQAYNKSSHGSMGPAPGDRSSMRSTSNENTMNPLQDKQKRFMHEEMQKEKSAWTQNSFPDSPSHIGQLNPSNPKTSQNPPASHHLNHLKHVGSVPEVRSENMPRSQHPPEARPHVLDSSVNSYDKAVQVIGMGEYSKHENSAHLQQSNFWHITSNNGLKDTIIPGQSDPNVAVGKQKVYDQVAGLAKFQYHPMGNLDENRQTYFGREHTDKAQAMSSEQILFAGHGPKSSGQNDKGKGSNFHTDMRKLHEASSVGLSMNQLPNKSFDKSGSSYLTNKTFQSSDNVLELLNKADQSRENSAEASRNSSEQNTPSEKPAARSPDAFMSQHNQFLGSHAYGLQLGPPHQRFPTQIHGSSQSLSQPPNSLSLNSGQFVQHHSSAAPQTERHDARSGVVGQRGNSISLHKVQESSNASITSGFPDLRNQFQNQETCKVSEKLSSNQCMPADTIVSQLDHTSVMHAKASTVQSSVGSQFNITGSNRNPVTSLPSSSQADKNIQSNVRPRQGSFHVGFPSLWTNVPQQQTSSGATSNSHVKISTMPHIMTDEQKPSTRGNDLLGSGVPNTNLASMYSKEDQHAIDNSKRGVPDETGLEPKAANIAGKDGFLSSGTVTNPNPNRNTYRSSVKSDTKSQNSYSLLHQLHVMRSTETDPNGRDSKRLKSLGSSSDAQQSPSRSGQNPPNSPTVTDIGNSLVVISEDSKLPNLTPEPNSNQGRYMPYQHGSTQYQNMPTLGRNDTQNCHHTSLVVSSAPLSHISPQMAPSWFEQCGTFNREQLLPASDVWKNSLSRPPELAQTPENSSSSFLAQNQIKQLRASFVADQVGDIKHSLAPEPVVIERSSSPPTAHGLVSVVPHELKTATSELVPRCEEVTQHGSRDLPNISASEVKWASATKRIPEKVIDEELEQAEDRTVMLKGKRRLVLTTQLMQQILEPPPASVMSSDAYMNHESVVYFTSKETCGSACSLCSSENPYMIYKKVPEKGDDLVSKVENGFLIRVSELENTLSSLEKQTSIIDLRTEWQDLEKFSVINRFAKFHGRGQADGLVTIHSAMNSPSHGPQRYVTALPSPRNLPDTVQCLSL